MAFPKLLVLQARKNDAPAVARIWQSRADYWTACANFTRAAECAGIADTFLSAFAERQQTLTMEKNQNVSV